MSDNPNELRYTIIHDYSHARAEAQKFFEEQIKLAEQVAEKTANLGAGGNGGKGKNGGGSGQNSGTKQQLTDLEKINKELEKASQQFGLYSKLAEQGGRSLREQINIHAKIEQALSKEQTALEKQIQLQGKSAQAEQQLNELISKRAEAQAHLNELKKQESEAPKGRWDAFLKGSDKGYMLQMQLSNLTMPLEELAAPFEALKKQSEELTTKFSDGGGAIDRYKESTERLKAAQEKLATNSSYLGTQKFITDAEATILEHLPGPLLAWASTASTIAPILTQTSNVLAFGVSTFQGLKSALNFAPPKEMAAAELNNKAASTMLAAAELNNKAATQETAAAETEMAAANKEVVAAETNMKSGAAGGAAGKAGLIGTVAGLGLMRAGELNDAFQKQGGLDFFKSLEEDFKSRLNKGGTNKTEAFLGAGLNKTTGLFGLLFNNPLLQAGGMLTDKAQNGKDQNKPPELKGDQKLEWDKMLRERTQGEKELALQRTDMERQIANARRDYLLDVQEQEIGFIQKRQDLEIKAQREQQDYQVAKQKQAVEQQKFDENFEGKQAAQKFTVDREKAHRDYLNRAGDREVDYQNKIGDEQKQFAFKLADEELAYKNKLADEELSHRNQMEDAAADHARKKADEVADHQKSLKREAEDFGDKLFDMASGSASALDYFKAARDQRKKVKRMNEDFDISQGRSDREFGIEQGRSERNYLIGRNEESRDYGIGRNKEQRDFSFDQAKEARQNELEKSRAEREFLNAESDAQKQRSMEIEKELNDRKYRGIELQFAANELELRHQRALEDTSIEVQRFGVEVGIARQKMANRDKDLTDEAKQRRAEFNLSEQGKRASTQDQFNKFLNDMKEQYPEFYKQLKEGNPAFAAEAKKAEQAAGTAAKETSGANTGLGNGLSGFGGKGSPSNPAKDNSFNLNGSFKDKSGNQVNPDEVYITDSSGQKRKLSDLLNGTNAKGYAIGSPGLPSDGLIYAHQGEAIINPLAPDRGNQINYALGALDQMGVDTSGLGAGTNGLPSGYGAGGNWGMGMDGGGFSVGSGSAGKKQMVGFMGRMMSLDDYAKANKFVQDSAYELGGKVGAGGYASSALPDNPFSGAGGYGGGAAGGGGSFGNLPAYAIPPMGGGYGGNAPINLSMTANGPGLADHLSQTVMPQIQQMLHSAMGQYNQHIMNEVGQQVLAVVQSMRGGSYPT